MPKQTSSNDFSAGKSEVLLVFPGKFGAPDPQVPLSLIYLAGSLRQAGYKPKILDLRTQKPPDIESKRLLFVGITCMSGQQIRFALDFAKKVRVQAPEVPIVWGGVHPSLMPNQTVANEYVDVVVRGEGELVIVDLADKLSLGQSLDAVKGLTFKRNGEIVSSPDGDVVDLDSLPLELPFDLLNLKKYPSFRAGRFHIQTSRGCPHRCTFCYNSLFHKRSWRAKSARRVVDEIEAIIQRFPEIKIIDPIDDNFFVDQKRVTDICRGLLNRGIHVSWRANCRFDYLSTYDQQFLALLERAGCVELDFGGESGSERLQRFICKDVTADQMLVSVKNLWRWASDIEPFVSWLSGLPGETYEDLKQTFTLMDKLSEANPRTQHYGIFMYTPFPSPLLETFGSEFKLPQSLEDWSKIEVFHFLPPWHNKKYIKKLQAISAVTRYAFYPQSRIAEHGLAFKIAFGAINGVARFRWKHRLFDFPFELRLTNEAVKRLRGFL